ncbi:fructose-1,6-bisphosphatase [bacterium]|nr:fructose-1,6-bisphosphatase [bacterium]
MRLEETFMHFLLEHQMRHRRTLNFLILMESIVTAAKYIQHVYDTGGLQSNMGEAGTINVQGENVMKMDLLAHQIVMHYLAESKQIIEATSEEITEEVPLNDDGRYFIYFDPLDGSSNIKHSLPVGFLFGIAKRNLDGPEDYHLRSGREFIAAGSFLIPSGVFTFGLKDAGTWRFLLDENQVYIRPTRVQFPSKRSGWELSWNAGNRNFYSDTVQNWVLKNENDYKFRYVGSLAVDFHRLLQSGGMFMYPAIVNHPKPGANRPEGKLRLIYECAVVAFLAHEAGGTAINEAGENILDIQPYKRHQRSTLFVGNKEAVEDIRKALKAEKPKETAKVKAVESA